MMKPNYLLKQSILLGAALLMSTAATHAALYQIDINTTALIGSTSAPFSLYIQLNSGDTLGNNTAILSNFSFIPSGGTPFGTATSSGGASGDLSSSITITDTFSFNDFFQSFTPGDNIRFDLSLTQNVDSGPTPDVFAIGILDSALFNIPTTGLGDALLIATINTPDPIRAGEFETFEVTGEFAGVRASVVSRAEGVPDAGSTFVLFGLALLGLAGLGQKKTASLRHS